MKTFARVVVCCLFVTACLATQSLLFAQTVLALEANVAQQPETATDKDEDAWKIPEDREKFHIFFLMGQSNMLGYDQLLPEDKEPVPYVVRPSRGGKGAGEWEPATHPLHNRGPKFGLGLPFAQEYVKNNPGVTVALIPAAIGGAPIVRLIRKYTGGKPQRYQKMEDIGVVKGVLWHQGESDTGSTSSGNGYEKRLHGFIKFMRDSTGKENLPFIVGDLQQGYKNLAGRPEDQRDKVIPKSKSEAAEKVRAALRTLPSKVPYTAFVESTDCGHCGHFVHFNRQGSITMGKRYAAAYDVAVKNKEPSDRVEILSLSELKNQAKKTPKKTPKVVD